MSAAKLMFYYRVVDFKFEEWDLPSEFPTIGEVPIQLSLLITWI